MIAANAVNSPNVEFERTATAQPAKNTMYVSISFLLIAVIEQVYHTAGFAATNPLSLLGTPPYALVFGATVARTVAFEREEQTHREKDIEGFAASQGCFAFPPRKLTARPVLTHFGPFFFDGRLGRLGYPVSFGMITLLL
jgi:hypothetical protein